MSDVVREEIARIVREIANNAARAAAQAALKGEI